jgi:hypothetical protein
MHVRDQLSDRHIRGTQIYSLPTCGPQATAAKVRLASRVTWFGPVLLEVLVPRDVYMDLYLKETPVEHVPQEFLRRCSTAEWDKLTDAEKAGACVRLYMFSGAVITKQRL